MASASVRALLLMLVITAACCGRSVAKFYEIGDSTGWSSTAHVDYQKWAATQVFRIGDVIQFKYRHIQDNVMRVTHEHFQACNATAPYATFTTGNDSITIRNSGHLYFISGFPGHCQAGQKVDIRVNRPGAPAPAGASPTTSPPGAPSPSAGTPGGPSTSPPPGTPQDPATSPPGTPSTPSGTTPASPGADTPPGTDTPPNDLNNYNNNNNAAAPSLGRTACAVGCGWAWFYCHSFWLLMTHLSYCYSFIYKLL